MAQKVKMILGIGKSKNMMTRNQGLPIKQGFTLIEVMLSVVILSLGFSLILQGFSQALSTLRISGNNAKASVLADSKMAELQINALEGQDALVSGVNEKILLNNIEFYWRSEVTLDQEDENLNKTVATLSWQEGKRKGATPIVTYLRSTLED